MPPVIMDYRVALEVLKFSNPEEAARHCSCVARTWSKATCSPELWWTYCHDRHIEETYFTGFDNALDAYKSLKATHFMLSIQAKDTLAWYDCSNRKFERILKIQCGILISTVQFTLMGDLSVIAVGGGNSGSNKVYKIYRNGHISALPGMISARMKFGLVQVQGRLYVFGGEHNSNELSSSEAFNTNLVPLRKWFPQGSMLSSRSNFTPAVYHSRIYLCGGGTQLCEVYDLSTRCFEPLSITLPFKSSVCAVAYSDNLVLLTPSVSHIYDIDTIEKKVALDHYSISTSYSLRPVIQQNTMFYLTQVEDNTCRLAMAEFPELNSRRTITDFRYPVYSGLQLQFEIYRERTF